MSLEPDCFYIFNYIDPECKVLNYVITYSGELVWSRSEYTSTILGWRLKEGRDLKDRLKAELFDSDYMLDSGLTQTGKERIEWGTENE